MVFRCSYGFPKVVLRFSYGLPGRVHNNWLLDLTEEIRHRLWGTRASVAAWRGVSQRCPRYAARKMVHFKSQEIGDDCLLNKVDSKNGKIRKIYWIRKIKNRSQPRLKMNNGSGCVWNWRVYTSISCGFKAENPYALAWRLKDAEGSPGTTFKKSRHIWFSHLLNWNV